MKGTAILHEKMLYGSSDKYFFNISNPNEKHITSKNNRGSTATIIVAVL